jgi:hypothetical protein
MFTRIFLVKVRSKALRHGIWFKVLDQVEREILNLTSIVVDRVESAVLGVELVKILRKLRDAMKSCFVRHQEEYGLCRAKVIAAQAQGWGYRASREWIKDLGFVIYLTVMDLNKPSGFGV